MKCDHEMNVWHGYARKTFPKKRANTQKPKQSAVIFTRVVLRLFSLSMCFPTQPRQCAFKTDCS